MSDNGKVRLTIGIACYDSIKVQTALCLAMAVKGMPHEMFLTARKGPYTHWNREALVKEAQHEDSTHLMFIDTDLIFPANGIQRLLDADKDVIGGMYNCKSLPPLNTVKLADEDGVFISAPAGSVPVDKRFRCAAVPTGFMLVKMHVFEGLEEPWFRCDQPVGEDVFFCQQAAKAGFEVWCDPTIELGHLGDYAY